jgi:hypothetical protein
VDVGLCGAAVLSHPTPSHPSLASHHPPPPTHTHTNTNATTTGKKKAGHGAEQGDSLYGIALLGLSLLMDGITGATQVGAKRWKRSSGPFETLLL